MRHVHRVPAKAVVLGKAVRRQEGGTLGLVDLLLALLADDLVFGQKELAKLAQVGHGGADAARSLRADALRRHADDEGVLVVVVALGGLAAGVRADRLGDVLLAVFAVAHAADLRDYHLRQGKAVVAVDREGTWLAVQRAVGQKTVDLLVIILVPAGAAGSKPAPLGAGQSAGVAQAVAEGDLFVPLVRHPEAGEVFADGAVQLEQAALDQLHDSHRAVDLGDGTDVVGAAADGVAAHRILGDDLPINHDGIGGGGTFLRKVAL